MKGEVAIQVRYLSLYRRYAGITNPLYTIILLQVLRLLLHFSYKFAILTVGEFYMIAVKNETEIVKECAYGDCPLHVENPPFNAKVLAAIAEGDAIFTGERSAKWYTSLEEAREDLGV
jgi:hypothetical protein